MYGIATLNSQGDIVEPSLVKVTANGALDVSVYLHKIDSTSGALALTLSDGAFDGQRIEAYLSVDGGDAVVTVASLAGGNTLTFADALDRVILEWDSDLDSGNGQWVIAFNTGAVAITTV